MMGELINEAFGALILAGFICLAIACAMQVPNLPTDKD